MKSPANAKEKKQEEINNACVVRKPAAAGKLYPSSAIELKKHIELFVGHPTVKQDVIGCILPHAAYVYSGRVAVETISRINLKNRIVLLGPNHTGYGAELSIVIKGAWETPLGKVKIDQELAGQILSKCRYLQEDTLAHSDEHSLEVELPFLQYFKDDFEITPIAISTYSLRKLRETGESIARCILDLGIKDSVMLVASSDMTHYESYADAERKDKIAIRSIMELNEIELLENIRKFEITMCGYAPIAVMLSAAKILGAKTAELIDYRTSADVTHDTQDVVGYAGIIVI